MKTFYLAANWKMNQSVHGIESYFEDFNMHLNASNLNLDKINVIIAVPSIFLEKAVSFKSCVPLEIAAQNCHQADSGAFTGEISVTHIKDAGGKAVIIGHSERRQYFNESNQAVGEKAKACMAAGLTPIICVGESKEEREGNHTSKVISQQMDAILAHLDSCKGVIFAYEPIWAIGTGLAASPSQANEVHGLIREKIEQKYGVNPAMSVPILYGGSMNLENCGKLLAQEFIDGGLIGGASLKPDQFAGMIEVASQS